MRGCTRGSDAAATKTYPGGTGGRARWPPCWRIRSWLLSAHLCRSPRLKPHPQLQLCAATAGQEHCVQATAPRQGGPVEAGARCGPTRRSKRLLWRRHKQSRVSPRNCKGGRGSPRVGVHRTCCADTGCPPLPPSSLPLPGHRTSFQPSVHARPRHHSLSLPACSLLPHHCGPGNLFAYLPSNRLTFTLVRSTPHIQNSFSS